MSEIKIFLAAPISAFKNEQEYKANREKILALINKLSVSFCVCSEISNIGSFSSYDDPGESALKDFKEIDEADVFIMYHPIKMQTSTLIELGYAVAKEKKIIMIAKPHTLPYLASGLDRFRADIKIISAAELDDAVAVQIEAALDELFRWGN